MTAPFQFWHNSHGEHTSHQATCVLLHYTGKGLNLTLLFVEKKSPYQKNICAVISRINICVHDPKFELSIPAQFDHACVSIPVHTI